MSHFSPPGMKYNRSSLLSLENNYRHANGGAKTLTIKKLKSVYFSTAMKNIFGNQGFQQGHAIYVIEVKSNMQNNKF